PDSELSALNRVGRLRVGPELWDVIEVALTGREATGGRFDPLVRGGHRGGGAAALSRDPATRDVHLGDGVTLDLERLAVAWCIDAVVDVLIAAGPCFAGDGDAAAFRGVPARGPWVGMPLDAGGLASVRPRRPARGPDAVGEAMLVARTAAWAEIRARSLVAAGMSAAVREATALGFDCVLTPAEGPARAFGAFAGAGI
ncbi:MAG TPA: hypothetical protein VL422_15080, partial [Miltoncostaea sp.]|nr:hypothetical protein [Miltoncostaea sp.]